MVQVEHKEHKGTQRRGSVSMNTMRSVRMISAVVSIAQCVAVRAAPATVAPDWPFITLRQTGLFAGREETLRQIVECHKRHPGACDEFWFATGARKPIAVVAKECEAFALCRAGTTIAFNNGQDSTVDGSVPTAEEPGLNAYAWYLAISGGVCHRIGQKLPNDWGFYDFHGCCWEWVLDCLKSDLGTAAVTDPKTGYGQGTNNNRVQRGGTYNQRSSYCRSALRSNSAATAVNSGFRVWCNLGD